MTLERQFALPPFCNSSSKIILPNVCRENFLDLQRCSYKVAAVFCLRKSFFGLHSPFSRTDSFLPDLSHCLTCIRTAEFSRPSPLPRFQNCVYPPFLSKFFGRFICLFSPVSWFDLTPNEGAARRREPFPLILWGVTLVSYFLQPPPPGTIVPPLRSDFFSIASRSEKSTFFLKYLPPNFFDSFQQRRKPATEGNSSPETFPFYGIFSILPLRGVSHGFRVFGILLRMFPSSHPP